MTKVKAFTVRLPIGLHKKLVDWRKENELSSDNMAVIAILEQVCVERRDALNDLEAALKDDQKRERLAAVIREALPEFFDDVKMGLQLLERVADDVEKVKVVEADI